MRNAFAGLAIAALLAGGARAQDSAAPLSRTAMDAKAALDSSAAALADKRDTPDTDSAETSKEPLGNFHEVGPGFYRSAQPRGEGYARLKKLGVKTILDLKPDADAERRDAAAVGIQVVQVAMNGLTTPTFAEVDRALDVVAKAERPLLVHCEHGQDRTGFVVAAYRVTVQRASIDAAVKEAKSYGCCFVLYEDLGKFLKRYQDHRRALQP